MEDFDGGEWVDGALIRGEVRIDAEYGGGTQVGGDFSGLERDPTPLVGGGVTGDFSGLETNGADLVVVELLGETICEVCVTGDFSGLRDGISLVGVAD